LQRVADVRPSILVTITRANYSPSDFRSSRRQNTLLHQTWKIISIARRAWANERQSSTNVSVFDQSIKLIGVVDVEVAIDTGTLQEKIRSVTGRFDH
jgi:hypothetical protein